MSNLNLEDFVDLYIESVLEAIQKKLFTLDVFYDYVFERVYERTGLHKDKIIYLHHSFQWSLFLENKSPLKIIPTISSDRKSGDHEIFIREENSPLEKSKLVADVLKEHRPLLQQRLDKVLKESNTSAQ